MASCTPRIHPRPSRVWQQRNSSDWFESGSRRLPAHGGVWYGVVWCTPRLVYTTSSSTPILWLAATTSILSVYRPSCLTVRVLLVLVSDCICQTQVRQNNYWDGNAVYHSMPINSKLWHKLNFQSLLPSLSRMVLRDFMSLTREWFSWNQFKDSDKLTPLFCSIAMAECIEPGTWTFGRNYLLAEAKIYY